MFLISLNSLNLIKLVHNTAAEYLSDLIPKLVVFIWGINMHPLEALRVVWEFISLLNLKRSSRSIGRFLFLKSNISFSCSTLMRSSNFKSLLSRDILFVWLLKGAKFIIRIHFFCKMVIVSRFSFLVRDQTGQPYCKWE